MSYRLSGGEYALDENGKPVSIEYIEELLQGVLLASKTPRGRFYPDKNFGSRLGEIDREPFEEYARAYISQAVDGLDGVFVKKVIKTEDEIKVQLLVNDSEEEVILEIEQGI